MKSILIKFLKIGGVTFILILLGLLILIFFTGPELPAETDSIIENVINSDIPEFVKGKSGYVICDNHKIWYESVTPQSENKGAVLIFMGISNDALGWPQNFIDAFADKGYQVIRYDYRGTGMSDWIEDWENDPFSLFDLSKDALAILDTLKIERTHLVGVSLGGMVAQEFAIKNPDRSLTLTSIMSSGYIIDKELPGISKSTVFNLIKAGIKYSIFPSDENTIKLHLAARIILRGEADYDIDIKGTSEQILYNIRKRNGYNPNASKQHHEATYRSGSRYEYLKNLKIPTLIIHGNKDPFIPIEHSKKLAEIIPGSKSIWYDNMGHDIPPYLVPEIVDAIISNFN